MAGHVHVVLREDVAKLGKTGELVRVRPGYARNFLVPRGLAAVATEGSVKRIEHERTAALARAAKLRTSAEAVSKALSSVMIEIAKQTGEEGRLYGSVTTKDVADALEKAGHPTDRKKISLPAQAIKGIGDYEVTVKLGPDTFATIKMKVVAKA